MQRHINQFVSDEWYNLLQEVGDIALTEMGLGYALLFGRNLDHALEATGDSMEGYSFEEQHDILSNSDFEYVDGRDIHHIWYKYGRLILQSANKLLFVYQYRGVLPGKLLRSHTLVLDDGLYADCTQQSTGILAINSFMEKNGEFIEPWVLTNLKFDGMMAVSELLDSLPQDTKDRLL